MSSRASEAVREIGIFLASDGRVWQDTGPVCYAVEYSSDDISNKVIFLPATYKKMRELGGRGERLWQALHPHLDDESMAFGGYVFDPELIQAILEAVKHGRGLTLGV